MAQLLDTTLRDGGYTVGFSFGGADTAAIAGALDRIGLPFIEIGHGLGLGAGRDPRYRSPIDDREWLAAARDAVHRGRWGAFFIPGIGRFEDIDQAADYGISFLRIGSNVTETGSVEPYLRRAKDRDLFVSCNLMKTYALQPDEVGVIGARLAEQGADVVTVVDSSGGMLPNEVAAYFQALAQRTDVTLGFHGHANLDLAVANALRAVEAGATIIDTSLRGIGRDAGNTPTETFVLALQRSGRDTGLDPFALMDLAEERVDPLLRPGARIDSLSLVCGYAQLHSAYLPPVVEQAEALGLDPRALVIEVSRHDRIAPSDELIRQVAEEMAGGAKRAAGGG